MARWLIFAMVLTGLGASQILAQTAGDYVSGRRFVQQRCVGCHSLAPGSSTVIAPSFPDIARNREKTDEFWRNWLRRPHEPMPDFRLTEEEISDIIAFLKSLEKSPADL